MTTVGQPAPGERRPRAARERLCLAVDLGTTGLEVGLVSFTGRVAWSEQVGLRTVQLSDGTAEQDAEAWWDAVLGTARRAVSEVDPGGQTSRRSRAHRPVGEHRPRRRAGPAGGRLRHVDGHPGPPPRP